MLSATVEVTIPGLIDGVEGLFRAHHGLVLRAAYRITGNAHGCRGRAADRLPAPHAAGTARPLK